MVGNRREEGRGTFRRCFEGGYVSSHRDGTTNRKLRGRAASSSVAVSVQLDPRAVVVERVRALRSLEGKKRERRKRRGGRSPGGSEIILHAKLPGDPRALLPLCLSSTVSNDSVSDDLSALSERETSPPPIVFDLFSFHF